MRSTTPVFVCKLKCLSFRDGSAVSHTDVSMCSLTLMLMYDTRAVGTPLEWPDAKKKASHVRDWGIEVSV